MEPESNRNVSDGAGAGAFIPAFNPQQLLFYINACGISADTSCSNHTMAGNEYSYWVMSDGSSHSLCRHVGHTAARSYTSRDFSVGRHAAVRNLLKHAPHFQLKSRTVQLHLRYWRKCLPAEVAIKPFLCLQKHLRNGLPSVSNLDCRRIFLSFKPTKRKLAFIGCKI